MTDLQGREINYLRVSITNQCNLSCRYCSPFAPTAADNLMTPMQIKDICSAAAECGINRVRFTGGEPLMRRDFAQIVKLTANIQNVKEIALTTNGILLNDEILALPIGGINISINATDNQLYKKFCGADNIHIVLKNAEKATKLHKVKINCVLLQDSYKQQAQQVIELGEKIGACVRFIELMPMGGGASLQGISTDVAMSYLTAKYGEPTLISTTEQSPARYFAFTQLKQSVGFISPMTSCFCQQCSRIRILSNGGLQTCLARPEVIDLLPSLKKGTVAQAIAGAIAQKQGRHDLQHITLTALKEIGG